MSYVPNFDDDIFISYAHIDDQPLTEGQRGWISYFHQQLETRLHQILGHRPNIWRDPKLSGNDFFSDELIQELPKKAILVSILTPQYINSTWCLREFQEFCNAAETTGGVRVQNKARIFKVVKTPVPRDKHPTQMQSLLGYKFYQNEHGMRHPLEFNLQINPSTIQNYFRKLDDLAYDIRELLDILKCRNGDPGKKPQAPSGPTIYLAETTFDLQEERDKIRRELQQRGCIILPDKPLPYRAADFRNAVSQYLSHSTLSIHLIGENYGIIPEAADSSVVCLQNMLAAEQRSNPAFSRIIWMPPGLVAKEARQQEFIESLRNDSESEHAPELLETPLEELKTFIQDKLQRNSQPEPTPPKPDEPVKSYLICDLHDLDAIKPLEDYLFEQGFEVIIPAMEGDEANVRADHQENLLWADVILIYYGEANETWFRTKLRDLQKVAGYGRTKPMLAKAIYMSAPQTVPKQHFRIHEALVIEDYGTFSPGSLKPLLDEIAERKGGLSR